MPISLLPARRLRSMAGLALFAFWLGWTISALAGIRPVAFQHGSADEVEAAVLALAASGVVPPGTAPLILHNPASACACDAEATALSAALPEHADEVVVLSADQGAGIPFELLILSADRRAAYAGPLVPGEAFCDGDAATRLSRWLPALLAGEGPPLVIQPSCHC